MSSTNSTSTGRATKRHLAIVRESASRGLGAPAGGQLVKAPNDAAGRAGEGRVGEGDERSVLQVGELAKLTGKTVRAIHLYESMGLLTPVDRSRGRFRLFNRDSVERVRWIVKLQTLGFSLPEIQDIVRGQEGAPTAVDAAARLREVYVEKLSTIQTKLTELHRLEHELVASLTYLDACQSACDGEAPTESCPSCGRHIDQPEQPSLVAGLHAT